LWGLLLSAAEIWEGDPHSMNESIAKPSSGLTYVDLGAYEFLGQSDDIVPPQVLNTVPDVIEAEGTSYGPITEIEVSFSEWLISIDADAPANYELRQAVNGIFDDGDDIVYDLTPQYSFDEATGAGITTLDLGLGGAALPLDTYRFTVCGGPTSAIHDTAGWCLDGDRDGVEGPDYVRTFTLKPEWTPPQQVQDQLLAVEAAD